jgi:hypothetical protein
MRKARVFISCGQSTKREKNIGQDVVEYFIRRGFKTYFAERVHSPDALTENIFEHLKKSEYFVFIDFQRELINEKEHRGSLFVNQEIALAIFSKLPGIGFYEKAVKREGILNYHIYNASSFEEISDIIRVLNEETKAWDNESANELEIVFNSELISRNVRLNDHPNRSMSNWYLLKIMNRNRGKSAFSCSGYITKIVDINNNNEFVLPSIELLWSGIGDINVNIMKGEFRELSAFFIVYDEGKIIFSHRRLYTTNPRYDFPRLRQGKYLIECVEQSET